MYDQINQHQFMYMGAEKQAPLRALKDVTDSD